VSFGNTAENSLLLLLLQNTAWANVGNAGGLQPSTVAGSFFVALHTATPGQTGNQSTSEAAYTNYARVGVARSSAGWTVSGSNPTLGTNAAATTFAQSGSGPEVETFFSVGVASSGATVMLWFGGLTSSLTVNNLITPSFALGALSLNCQ
jgi:hypothetical protein